jgi:predicted MFS family arabinose efflux permease
MASATSAGWLYLSTGFVIGIGTGAASFAVVLAAVGRMAPPEKRMMALGITSAMGSVGQFVLVPVIQRVIDARGWEAAALLLAVVILGAIAAAPGLRGRAVDFVAPQAPGSEAEVTPLRWELRRAAHSNSYRLVNLAFFVCGFHVTFIATHLASHAEDLGQGRSVAANALALIGLFNIAGTLAAGALGSRYSKTRLLSLIYLARAALIGAYILLPADPALTVAFGAAIGVLWLSTVPLTSGIVASQFGTTHSGTLFGIVFLSHQVGAFAGAWLGGSLADRAGSYTPVWWIAAGLGVWAAVLHLFVDDSPQPAPPTRPRRSGAPSGRLIQPS